MIKTLSSEQRLVGAAALVALPTLHLLFRHAGLRAVRLVLRGGTPPSVGSTVDPVDLGRRLAVPVHDVATAMKLGDRSCLSRASFLWWLLRRRGIAATVVIGSRASDAGLEAHAWVEVDGHPVDDTADVTRLLFDGFAAKFVHVLGDDAPEFLDEWRRVEPAFFTHNFYVARMEGKAVEKKPSASSGV